MKRFVLFLFSSLGAMQAATTVTISPTSTQALIRIHTDQPGNCTFRASEGAAIGALVYDVDPAKFSGSNSDARPGSVVGLEHFFVLGTRTAAKATDGKWYSRALQANTQHTVECTCGTDVITKTFSTVNPPLGNTAGEVMPFDPAAPYNAALPSIDMSMTSGRDTGQATKYVDPLTGILAVRVTGPMQGSSIFATGAVTPPIAFPSGGAWTNPSNAVGTSGFATTGSAGPTNALFVPFGLTEALNYRTFGEWDSAQQIDDMNVSINASGSSGTSADRVLLACISLHHGASCDTDTITINNVPQSTASQVNLPNTGSPTVYNPFWKLWTSANPYPASIDLGTNTGTATISGSNVSWASGAQFSNRLIAGDRIKIVGSGCSNGGSDYCTIASVTDSKHIVINESGSVAAPAAFTIQNAGLRIWKNNGNGTVSINTVRFYAAVGMGYATGANPMKDMCSPNTFTLAINRDGTTRSPSVPARLCQFQSVTGSNSTYVWVPDTGEAWHLMNGATTYPGPGGLDTTLNGGQCSQDGPSWHVTDPFSTFCVGNTNGVYSVVFKFTYRMGSAPCDGREWNDTTYGSVLENPCVSVAIDTPASANKDVVKLFQAFDSSFDSSYFGNVRAVGGVGGKYIAFEFLASGQGSRAYFGWYDTAAKNFIKSADSFRTFPARWGTDHGNTLMHNLDSSWSILSVNVEDYFRSGTKGDDRSEMSIVSIAGRADNSLPSNFFTACPQGLDARWTARGAVGNHCVTITMDGEPRMQNPSAADLAKWPHSALNAGWAQMQTIAEGDVMFDNSCNGYCEGLMVVKKTPGSGNQIVLDLLRGPAYSGLSAGCTTPANHAAAWIPVMRPSDSCGGGTTYWVNLTGNAAPVAETYDIGALHGDTTGIGPGGGLLASGGGNYQVRLGGIPSTAGTAVSWSNPMFPAFNGSAPSQAEINALVQTHPSIRQVKAPLTEQAWMIDGHPYGGPTGGGTGLICNNRVTLVAGTAHVYNVSLTGGGGTPCPSTLDVKNFPLEGVAGRFLLQDKSGPASMITDSDSYKFCYAFANGECRPGSNAGDIFASVPFGNTDGNCSFYNYDQSQPCIFPKYSSVGNIVQVDLHNLDAGGHLHRRLGYGFTVPTHTNNYWNGTSDPDGRWAFFSTQFADNMVVNQYFAYKLPPIPKSDSTVRNGYVNVPITIQGAPGQTVRVRFGYAENGAVDGSASSLYCTSRAESCYTTVSPTSSNPFVFAGETQSFVACDTTCTVNVPALANRVVYVIPERKNGAIVTPSAVQAVAVP